MGWFSSSSKSYSTTQNFDRRIAGEGSVIAAEGSSVTINDVSNQGLEAITNLGSGFLGFANTAQKESARLSEAALDRAFDSTAGGSADLFRKMITYGAVAAIAIVAFKTAPKFLGR